MLLDFVAPQMLRQGSPSFNLIGRTPELCAPVLSDLCEAEDGAWRMF